MAIPRTTDTDDDGSGTTGTIRNNAWLQAIYDVLDGRWSCKAITLTGSQNNLSIADSNGQDADFIIFNNATDLTITGIAAPASPAKPGKPLRYACIGAGNVYFKHQSASSTAANRFFNIATSGDTPHNKGAGILVYDDGALSTTACWRLVHHVQGGAIDYTASSTITGWSSFTSGRKFVKYTLTGRVLLIQWHLEGTSNATTADMTFPFKADGSGSYPYYQNLMAAYDNTVYLADPGTSIVSPNTSKVNMYTTVATAAWTASGSKIVNGEITLVVA